MNTRSTVRTGFAVVVVSLLLQPGAMWAQKGKAAPATTPRAALFGDNDGDKIRSDGGGAYYTVLDSDGTYSSVVELDRDGRLNMRVVRNRRVFFEFDTPVRPAPLNASGQLTCHEWTGGVFYADPPSFLPPGVPDNDSFYLSTFGEITYNGTEWVYDPVPPFDFRTMKVDATARSLVRVQFNFYTVEDAGLFGVMPNYKLWTSDAKLAGGVVQVRHPSANVWVVEPQSPDDPDAPLRSLGPNEAGFKVGAPAEKRVHEGGNCDLGDWVMPFQLTLYKQ